MSHQHENKCFFSQVRKAIALEKTFRLYVREKENSKATSGSVNDDKCLHRKIQEPEKASLRLKKSSYFKSFLVEESVQNFVLKSVLGFIGGVLLTYICFLFLVFSLNFTLKRATYICMGLGVVLSLGLAFSVKIRCTVFLCIPQLFSKRGRQALLAYAFILALSGPAKNTLHNVEVMSESLACGQEQIKQAENELLKCVQRPNAAAKKSVEKLLIKLNSAVKYFKNFILQFYRSCFDICRALNDSFILGVLVETIRHVQNWLYSISLLCNEKMGSPTERCQNLLVDSCENCLSATDLIYWKKLCQIHPFAVQFICETDQNQFCYPEDVSLDFPVEIFHRRLDEFKRRALNVLYVKVNVHQTFIQSNHSNTIHEEYQGMATEIRQKTDQFLQYFDFMSVIFGIFILVLFAKVIIYRHKFLTEDHYDNRFITPDFEDIDNTRAEFKMETILPLKPREKTKYIKVTSIRLVPCEKIRLLSSFVFLIFATFKIVIHMLTDSSLYWILSSVRRDERLHYINSLKEEETGIVVKVVGSGLVAELFQNISTAVQRQYLSPKLDPTPCLPDPVSPDWNRYYQILALVLICWLLALFEPYGLRLRHTVMVTYHPDRARERAIWLYNKIISHRNSYVKIARRKIRRKYKTAPEQSISPKFQFFCGSKYTKCLLCKMKITSRDKHVKCPTQNCVGIFCADCYTSLKYCSICTSPAQYGDLSDLSEEKDSSEEEIPCTKGKNENASNKQRPEIRVNDSAKAECVQNAKVEKAMAEPEKVQGKSNFFKALERLRQKISKWEESRSSLGEKIKRKHANESKKGLKEETYCKKLKEEKELKNVNLEKAESDQKLSVSKEKGLHFDDKNKFGKDSSKEEKKPLKPDFLFRNLKTGTIEKKNLSSSEENNSEMLKSVKTEKEDVKCSAEKKVKKIKTEISTSLIESNNKEINKENKNVDKPEFVRCTFRYIVKKDLSEFESSLSCQNLGFEMMGEATNERGNKTFKESFYFKRSLETEPKIDSSKSLSARKRVRLPQARICTRSNSSSDSLSRSYRLCSKKRTSSSDNQLLRQASHSSDSLTETYSRLKRTPGHLSLGIGTKSHTSYTDSSNDRFLSVKSTKNVNNPPSRGSEIAQKSKLFKNSNNYFQTRFYKKNSRDKRTLGKKDSSKKRDECLDECKSKKFKKKSGQLSWAPDLLSDLPSTSKRNVSDASTDND